ncbi:MAG: hypothetical protein N2447_00335 [Thermoanaerobaculum sp.]|nr:hypothetical protein [Thermoanaerobaculum sp.]
MEGPWSFEVFWRWLLGHANCILRAGTPEVAIYDDEDLHWHIAAEEQEGFFLVQVLRGKRPMAELWVAPDEVSYVQASPGDAEGEFIFELISETERDRFAAYVFVLSHGFTPHEDGARQRIH